MKILSILLLFTIKLFGQNKTICMPPLQVHDYMANSCDCDSCLMKREDLTYIMCIGRNADFTLSSHHIIVLGDFKERVQFPAFTIYYLRNFWYFKTKMGNELLKYLDLQSAKPRTRERIIIMQEHIIKYYLSDIQKKLQLRDRKQAR